MLRQRLDQLLKVREAANKSLRENCTLSSVQALSEELSRALSLYNGKR